MAAVHGPAAAVILAIVFGAIGAVALLPGRWPYVAGAAGLVAALAIWVLSEGFGGIGTGQATDPNTGPLLGLAAVAMWSAGSRRPVLTAVRRAPAPEAVADTARAA